MITLNSRLSRATINPLGAWVEEFSIDTRPVLFPLTNLVSESGEQKTRGGMHICLPNFGPSGNSQLEQHGFGRKLPWKISHQKDNSVTMVLKSEQEGYRGLEATLVYELQDPSLSANLTVKNVGLSSFRVAPAFHPYFFLDESDTAIAVNDTTYELSTLGGTEFIEADSANLRTSSRDIVIEQTNLATWAIWTDCLANYACVEPTAGGYRFLEASTPDEIISAGQSKQFGCTITVK